MKKNYKEYDFVDELDKLPNKIVITDEYIIFNGVRYIREK